jgi:hypothetical protein
MAKPACREFKLSGCAGKGPSRHEKKALRGHQNPGASTAVKAKCSSCQMEIFLGFFLTTTKFRDLNHTLRNHPLLTPLQAHEGLSEARHSPFEPTGVAVKKKTVKFSAN